MLSHRKCIFCKTELYCREILIIFFEVSESSLGNTDSNGNILVSENTSDQISWTLPHGHSNASWEFSSDNTCPSSFCKSFLVWATPQMFLKLKHQTRYSWAEDPNPQWKNGNAAFELQFPRGIRVPLTPELKCSSQQTKTRYFYLEMLRHLTSAKETEICWNAF